MTWIWFMFIVCGLEPGKPAQPWPTSQVVGPVTEPEFFCPARGVDGQDSGYRHISVLELDQILGENQDLREQVTRLMADLLMEKQKNRRT